MTLHVLVVKRYRATRHRPRVLPQTPPINHRLGAHAAKRLKGAVLLIPHAANRARSCSCSPDHASCGRQGNMLCTTSLSPLRISDERSWQYAS
mmetsp:Transcript_67560/g.179697  ORF Transcript_67560/g.179697 Transcript_67560/m.179697 type:complete len:93 (+) Transcript_67560:92-370(+)